MAGQHEERGDGPHPGAWDEEPDIDGWVWDGAGGHKSGEVQALPAPQVVQPPYAPEPDPVERFFQELRRGPWGTGSIRPWRPKRRPWNRS